MIIENRKETISGVYIITNKINGNQYVGKSNDIRRRWKEHRSKYSWKQNTILYRAFRKYGIENFDFEILEECSADETLEKEMYYIEFYNTFKKGYNATKGGEGIHGFHHTEETKKKISERFKGENHPLYGIPMSEDQKNLRKIILKGRVFSDETKEKMRNAKIGLYKNGNHPKAIKVECNGLVFDSIKECAEYLNVAKNVIRSWLNKRGNMPKKYIDMNLRYYGDKTTVYESQTGKNQAHKVICEGVIYDSARDCAKYYGIKDGTLRSWVAGRRKMPSEFVNKGLRLYSDDEESDNIFS